MNFHPFHTYHYDFRYVTTFIRIGTGNRLEKKMVQLIRLGFLILFSVRKFLTLDVSCHTLARGIARVENKAENEDTSILRNLIEQL